MMATFDAAHRKEHAGHSDDRPVALVVAFLPGDEAEVAAQGGTCRGNSACSTAVMITISPQGWLESRASSRGPGQKAREKLVARRVR
jgi:hypothetical protein